jgi:hypothetical protein
MHADPPRDHLVMKRLDTIQDCMLVPQLLALDRGARSIDYLAPPPTAHSAYSREYSAIASLAIDHGEGFGSACRRSGKSLPEVLQVLYDQRLAAVRPLDVGLGIGSGRG